MTPMCHKFVVIFPPDLVLTGYHDSAVNYVTVYFELVFPFTPGYENTKSAFGQELKSAVEMWSY